MIIGCSWLCTVRKLRFAMGFYLEINAEIIPLNSFRILQNANKQYSERGYKVQLDSKFKV